MIRRFVLLSVLAHAAVLAALWSPPARRVLAPPRAISAELIGAPATAPPAATVPAAVVQGRMIVPAAAAPDWSVERNDPPSAAIATDGARGRDTHANHLQLRLRGLVAEDFHYPPLARRNGWQGRVELELALDGDGGIRALRVARSSGYAILDEDALDTVRRVESRPEARRQLAGCACELRVPILYRLIEG